MKALLLAARALLAACGPVELAGDLAVGAAQATVGAADLLL